MPTTRIKDGQMQRTRLGVVLWLLAGVAFLIAGLMADRRQPALFAVAVLNFAVSIVTLRRARPPRPPAA